MPADRWDELENAYPSLAPFFPNVKSPTIRPMGWLEKLLGGSGNVATTDLDGTIAYNAAAARRDGRPPEQILAHELEHAQQNAGRSLWDNIKARFTQGAQPYAQRADEKDAMAAENRRYRRNEDIRLPPSVTAIK